ncbi:sigma-70 family RNA polymerase sigma factor [Streptomyces zagrosensis]|uniref:Transposase-like protein n=1 Tax=Streptomyces zagrosensis TaxID=1042984 RepID=A0A7W9Q8Y7_9ACTN|nr:sigma-70 family RNA polymerase sigma factor [Streptomyces zagrosensis]MBB5934872.1 transposase-like protein [Streptomyces zagrosensis]
MRYTAKEKAAAIQELIKGLAAGKTVGEITVSFDMSSRTARRWLNEAGVKLPGRYSSGRTSSQPISPESASLAAELYFNNGLSLAQISRQLGMSSESVRKRVERIGEVRTGEVAERSRRVREALTPVAKKMYLENTSTTVKECASRLGVSVPYTRHLLRDACVVIRRPGRPRKRPDESKEEKK